MKSRFLLVTFIAFLTFGNSSLFSQINDPHLFADVFSLDSLQGFDQNLANQKALNEGYYGKEYANAIKFFKRQFVITKYDLYAKYNDPQNFAATSGSFGKYGSATTANAPCVNEGFESGTLTGWIATRGINNGAQTYPTTPITIVSGPEVSVVPTPVNDPFVGLIPNSPLGGSNVVRINNSATGAVVVKLSQTFSVTPTNYLFDFAYWAVMQDAGAGHDCDATPYMLIKIRDNFGNLQGCPNFSIVAPASGGGCSGVGPLTWVTVGSGINTVKTSSSWQKFSIDLSSYITSPLSNVTIEVIVADCSLTGHFGYAYFDSNCNTMNLTVNSNLISMPSPSVFPQVICGGSATMTAPAGLGPYVWYGPPLSGVGVQSVQTITTSVPGNYTLEMRPVGICNPPITKIVNLSFVPPTTVTASPANLCATGTNTSSTLSAVGATQYTWMPGGSNLSTIVVSPTITTIYTVTARTGTCVGNFTVQVTVNPDPVVSIFSTHASLCPGQTATLTAFGANSYFWLPIAQAGSQVSVSQAAATTYTAIGTSTAGCTNAATIFINQTSAPPVSIFPATVAIVCPNTPVNLIGLGAPTFTWYPGGAQGIFQTFSPSSTTEYTAVGSVGSCTAEAKITITVDPGPSMTVTSSPAIICPGGSATLTSISPAALGFTWSPVASNASFVVVTPASPTTYTVRGHNSNGCISTYTVEPIISTPPSISISPTTPSICSGSSITLTGNGGVSYTWTPGGPGTSISVSPSSNTAYTVVGANAAGCTNQATVMVTVVTTPTIAANAVPPSICAGSCFTFNTSGAASYTFSPATFCPLVTTPYTVIGSTGGCTSTPVVVNVTVNTGPAMVVSANPASICPGGSSTLTATSATGYTWQPVNLNGSPIVVSPLATTVYTVTGQNAFGCITTQTVMVTVNSAPTIMISPASATICSGTNTTLTGNGGVSYTWTPGGSGSSIVVSPVINTTYTLVGANAAGCTNSATALVTVITTPTITSNAVPPSICAGNCFTLNNNGAASYNVIPSNLCPTVNTVYNVTGTTNGCVSAPVVISVTVSNGPSMTASANLPTICPGGSSTLSATGAIGYTWQPVNLIGTPVTVSPVSTTVYTVTGVNAIGCTSTQTVLITVAPIPAISISPTSATICSGTNTTLTGNGGVSYTWTPGGVGSSILVSPTSNTTYTVVGASAAGCTNQATALVAVITTPTITSNAVPPAICAGSCFTLNNNGAASYNVIPSNLCPTITTVYNITGTTNGCVSAPVTITVTVNNGPTLSPSATPATVCPGGNSTLNATGALSYTWQPGNINGSSIVVNPLVTTVYNVTGINASGCTSVATVTVFVTPPPSVSASSSPTAICAGASATLSGFGAATYTWLPVNLIGQTVFVSPASTTNYTVIGSNGSCTGSTVITLVVNPIPTVNITSNPNPPVICPGGVVTLTASGANTYSWSTTQTASIITVSPLSNTTYNLFGVSNGCQSAIVPITVTVNSTPIINPTANPTAICAGSSSTLSATGALTYTWQPVNIVGNPITVNPLSTTVYTVTGTNGPGCTGSATVAVTVNPLATVFAVATPTSICSGQSSNLVGGGAVSYTWLPVNITGSNVTVFPASTTIYTVNGLTGAGCPGQATVVVQVSPTPTLNASISPNPICAGSCATLSANGATNYTWVPGNLNGATVVVCPPAGNTSYSVTGSNGVCSSAIVAGVLTVTPLPVITVTASPGAICAGSSSTLSANGATSYMWLPGNIPGSSIVVTPSVTTTYTVTGTIGTGCSTVQTITIFVTPIPTIIATASPANICPGQVSTLSATGAGSFTWQPMNQVATSVTVAPLSTTNYTVFGSSGGCIGSTVVTVFVNPAPAITANASPATLCAGGTTTLSATGGTNYTWFPGPLFGNPAVASPVITTVYTVNVVSSFGCLGTGTVLVTVNPVPSLSITSNNNPICSGSSAQLTANGANFYVWSPGPVFGSPINVSPTITTVYTLTGTAVSGCSATANYTLVVIPTPTLVVGASSPTVCAGFTVGLFATGGTTYTWLPNFQNGAAISETVLANTVFTVLSGSGGCNASATISITAVPLPNVQVTANPSVVCSGNSTTLTATGASTYSWIPTLAGGNTFIDTPGTTTTYTVVGFASSGCPNFDTVTVNVLSPPTISISSSSSGALCAGTSATLTASGATSYTWSTGGNGATLVIAPGSNTVYSVIGDNGGCTGTASINITVNPLPPVVAFALNSSICAGGTASLSASGALNYTWNPTGQTGANITDTPVFSTTYTVTGEDANGCTNQANVAITVNQGPTITAVATPSMFCSGGTTTLTATGALSYTWNPNGQVGSVITETPSASGDYTVSGTDINGCIGVFSLPVVVVPIPTLNVTPFNSSVCIGSSATLIASGATNYTWFPSGTISATTIETPVANSNYTVVGDNAGICFSSFTVDVFVNPLPANVVASSVGTVSCASPSVTLFGSSTDTNVSYAWAGPTGYNSSIQNPTVTGIWGTFTLSVTDNVTGCTATSTVDVPTDNSIPFVTAVASGSITCAVPIVTLNAVHSTTNPAYNWAGPSGFTSSAQSPTINLGGDYTITVTDLSSSCSATSMVSIGSHTTVLVTSTITPSGCEGGISMNNGSILVANFAALDKYDIVSGPTYTGTATYTTAALIPISGVITNNLANPTSTVAYTLRIFDVEGCIKDTVLYLIPVDCSLNTFGISKSVSTPSLNSDGSYNITYTIVVKNYDTDKVKGSLRDVKLTEDLSVTFQGATGFTLVNAPVVNAGGSLTLNPNFNGSTETGLTTPSLSVMEANESDTITFTVKVKTSLFFVGFKNSVLGEAVNTTSVVLKDSSNTGMDPDPDNDLNPKNNNIPTSVIFTPNAFFGLTKTGEFYKSDDNSYDISYVISVHNRGNDTLRDVTVIDSLFGRTIKNPASYSMRSGPVTTGGLTANNLFDGNTQSELLIPNESKLAPGTIGTISFVINVVRDTVTVISNSASGSALRAVGLNTFVPISDISNAGNNPDVNGNGVWDEASDNVPTVLILPTTHTLFIPEGFSPNGDDLNQNFVIQGLPEGQNSLTIFNRWGNKVYQNPNYDNSWDGTPNVSGTLGKNKLPQGTYYFILDMKGSGVKPISGFIVLQY